MVWIVAEPHDFDAAPVATPRRLNDPAPAPFPLSTGILYGAKFKLPVYMLMRLRTRHCNIDYLLPSVT
jgi:hypothetical protein